jgi:hypothetical protein
MLWRKAGKLENKDARKVVRALRAYYPDYMYKTVSGAFLKVVNVVHAHVQECGELPPYEFFDQYKIEISWAKKLKTSIVKDLFLIIIKARVVNKNMLQDMPTEGEHAPPKVHYKETALTKSIDSLLEKFIQGYSRGFPEVLWDWGWKDGEDTDFESGNENSEASQSTQEITCIANHVHRVPLIRTKRMMTM